MKYKKIKDEIQKYQSLVKNSSVSAHERKVAYLELKRLRGLNKRYNVVLIPDKRMLKVKTNQFGHNYIVTNNNKEFIHVNQVSHKKFKNNLKLHSFDGKSNLNLKTYKRDKNGLKINYQDCYISKYTNKPIDQRDIETIDDMIIKK